MDRHCVDACAQRSAMPMMRAAMGRRDAPFRVVLLALALAIAALAPSPSSHRSLRRAEKSSALAVGPALAPASVIAPLPDDAGPSGSSVALPFCAGAAPDHAKPVARRLVGPQSAGAIGQQAALYLRKSVLLL